MALLAPFEREQRLSEHRRWCAGICGNSLLQTAEAGLQLVGTEVSEERKGAQAQPLEHVTASAGGRLGNRAEERSRRCRTALACPRRSRHPALAVEAQVALTLRTLGGLSTDEIAVPSWYRSARWRSGSAGLHQVRPNAEQSLYDEHAERARRLHNPQSYPRVTRG